MAKKSKDLKNMRPTLVRTEGGITKAVFNWETSNFWDVFPEVKVLEVFEDFYKYDKSPKKVKSSATMWGIHIMCHPASMIYNLENKLELTHKKFSPIGDYNIEQDPLGLIEEYTNLVLPEAYRLLTKWYQKMRERSEMLDELSYDLNNLEKLDKAMASTKSLWDAFGEIRDQVLMQEGQSLDDKTLSQQGVI